MQKKLSFLPRLENTSAFVALGLVALIQFIEIIGRKAFGRGIFGASDYIHHLILLTTFLGSLITTREKKHLAISAAIDVIKGPIHKFLNGLTSFFSITISSTVILSSISMAFTGFNLSRKIGFIPLLVFTLLIPLTFLGITIRFFQQSPKGKTNRLIMSLAVLLGIFLASGSFVNLIRFLSSNWGFMETWDLFHMNILSVIQHPFAVLLVFSAFFGTPIFIVLGGLGMIFFAAQGVPPEILTNEAYTILTSHSIPAIPLFTLTGFILSESKAGERLVRLFKALLGWLPGGFGIMTVLILAFFTTFTGASGVTILALGGLLSYVLIQNKYKEKFSLGLLTSSGSIGLLFPPSLPIIMYGIMAHIDIRKMFVGGILPGILLVLTVSIMSVIHAVKNKVPGNKFNLKEVWKAFIPAIWEVLLPVVLLTAFFTGLVTIVEISALAVFYVFIVEIFIHRDIKLKSMPHIFSKTLPVIGGILIILAFSRGLSNYIIDTQIPMKMAAWMQMHISSKYVFLLILNVVLLITGCFLDIFSAIMVVGPIIIPIGMAYGIDPVHLGIIFLANLELGYLTPPVGLNLFLASYRFEKPLSHIYKTIIPFLIALLFTVLLITYVPLFSTALLKLFPF